MSYYKNVEWTIIKTHEEDDFICIEFDEGEKKEINTTRPRSSILKSNSVDEIENLGRIKPESEPQSDKKRNRLSIDDYHHDWEKYISIYRKSIYDDEIENLQSQLKKLKTIQGNIERDLEYNKKNQQKFKEFQNKYIENQSNIKKIEKNINDLLQDIYKLNQLKDNGNDLLNDKISFELFNNNNNVNFKNLQKLPAEFVAFPAFLVEFNHRKDSISKTNGDLRYLDSLPQGIKDDIIKSASKHNIKYTISAFNEYEKSLSR